MPKSIRNIKKTSTTSLKILAVVSFVILFLSYSINLFGLGLPGFFNSYQKDSEALVVNEVGCKIIHGQDIFGGMLVSVGGGTPNFAQDYANCSTKVFAGYISQFNIQGKIITLFAPHDLHQLGSYIKFVKLISTLIFAAAITYLVVIVAKEFSLLTAGFLLAGLAISDWMVFMARNLYWMPILLFAPFIFSFAFYEKWKIAGKLKIFYLVFGALVSLKALAGYEFITCVILASFAPILYYEVKSRGKIEITKLIAPFLKVMLVGVAGFAIAVALHVAQLSLYFHSFQHGVSAFQNRAFERTVGQPGDDLIVNLIPQSKFIEPTFYEIVNNVYYLPNLSHSSSNFLIIATVMQILIFLFLDLYTFPIVLKGAFGTFSQAVAFTIFISALIFWVWRRNHLFAKSPQHLALFATVTFAFLSSISWIFLAHPHAIHHLHLTGIVYYLPYALIFYIMIGFSIDGLVQKLRALYAKKI